MRKFSYIDADSGLCYNKGYYTVKGTYLAVPKIEGEYFYLTFGNRREPLIFQLRGELLVGLVNIKTSSREDLDYSSTGYQEIHFFNYTTLAIYKDWVVIGRIDEDVLIDYLGTDIHEIYL